MDKYKWLIISGLLFVLVALLCYRAPKITEVEYKSMVYDLSKTDSLLVGSERSDRQVGYVNLEMFKGLATSSQYFRTIEKARGDSLRFVLNDVGVVFGTDAVLCKHENLQISIDENSFTAAVKKIDGVEYIYIPYHILATLAGWSGTGK